MVNVRSNFSRIAAAFDQVSDGVDQEDNGADLSDLVNSFLERGSRGDRQSDEDVFDDDDDDYRDNTSESRDILNCLFAGRNDAVRGRIHAEVVNACREINGGKTSTSSPEFKRRLIARLRSRGFDAGLCKSKCDKDDKNGRRRTPLGEYEYVDVYAAGNRYIIEPNFDGEFTIARPTAGYTALLELFHPIFVGKSEELEQVVRVMCKAIRVSMRSVGISVPPWRRTGYMRSKWFGLYKRTTNEIVSWNACVDIAENQWAMQSVGVKGISFDCRYAFVPKAGDVRVGNLTAILNL